NLRCGRRLVSGLFSRPRLPLGYSYVTTVPRGACRLNVSEIVSSENYIALKISNGSYIMNGEFAVSTPGTYEAAGTRFTYSRAGGLDEVFGLGPIHHPIDIMYEYFTESLGGETDVEPTRADFPDPTYKHTRRHQGLESYKPSYMPRHQDLPRTFKEDYASDDLEDYVGSKFVWKILSYTQCTRTCGGGIKVNFSVFLFLVSFGSPPAARMRRCGRDACPPRWRAAAWSTCPKCGPASRTRIVGCVEDFARGITKISDQKCPSLKPPTIDKCDIPNCDDVSTGEVRHIEPRTRPREHTDTFRDGPVYTVAVNRSDIDIGPEYSFSAAAGWLYTDWSECVGWCVGSGVQTRSVRCADPSGCAPRRAPDYTRSCTAKVLCEAQDGDWFLGNTSQCVGWCEGSGVQTRSVRCADPSGCVPRRAPDYTRSCTAKVLCEAQDGDWFVGNTSQCVGWCEGSRVQTRSVRCADPSGCAPRRAPDYTRSCTAKVLCEAQDGDWFVGNTSQCVGWCEGSRVQTRSVRCADPSGCAPRRAPDYTRSCTAKVLCEAQDGDWFLGNTSQCVGWCEGSGVQTRSVRCADPSGCAPRRAPDYTRSCEWSRCSSECAGRQVRGVLCIGGTGRHLRDSACKGPRPEHERECGADCPPAWYFSDWGKRRSVLCARGNSTAGGVSDIDCTVTRPNDHRSCELRCASTLPPDLTIESQKSSGYETTISNIQKDASSRETETKGEWLRETETKGEWLRETETKGEWLRETETKGEWLRETETKGEWLRETETKGEWLRETETKGEWLRETDTKGEWLRETETKGKY
ncbi:putative thrombospondin repeat protein 1, partial [Operophtera brumata]